MEDYRKKKITKAQLWDKLHEERFMWQNKCQHDVAVTKINTALEIRKIVDPILAKVALAFGKPDQEGEYILDIELPENREGHEWQVRLSEIGEGLWQIGAKEMELPDVKEELEEQNEGKTIEFKKFDPDRVYHAKSKEDALQHLKDAMNKQEEEQ